MRRRISNQVHVGSIFLLGLSKRVSWEVGIAHTKLVFNACMHAPLVNSDLGFTQKCHLHSNRMFYRVQETLGKLNEHLRRYIIAKSLMTRYIFLDKVSSVANQRLLVFLPTYFLKQLVKI